MNTISTHSNMVSCFAVDCNHTNESHHCKFYRFPSEETHKSAFEKWTALTRYDGARPKVHSRLCSCHFKYGLHKLAGEYVNPTIFKNNKEQNLPHSENPQKKRKTSYHRVNVSHKQMKTSQLSTVPGMASGGRPNIPHNSVLVHGVPVQSLPQMQNTHSIQRAQQQQQQQQMAQVHHQPQVQVQAQAQAAAHHQFLTAGRSSAPQSKYADLLAVIEDMGRDIRPTYAGSRMATERLKRGIVHAKSLVRECLAETERSARN